MNKIKILIIDDELSWSRQIAVFLNMEPDLLVVGTANNKAEGCRLARILKPQIILLDLYLEGNGPDGLIVLQELVKECHTKVIVATVEEDPRFIKEALLSGATEYVIKDNFKTLPEMIRTAQQRQLPAEIMAKLAKEYLLVNKQEELLDEFNLTAKEKQVFNCVARNLTCRQTARELGVEEKTIKNYKTSINEKLNTKGNSKKAVEKVRRLLDFF
ncbi:MAG TPA: response regulator transcription factor [Bacillota bacterium]